jgi:hypothetical protein
MRANKTLSQEFIPFDATLHKDNPLYDTTGSIGQFTDPTK